MCTGMRILLLHEAGHDSCSSSVLHELSCSMYRQLLYRLADASPNDVDLPNAASCLQKTQATINDESSTRGAYWSARTIWGVDMERLLLQTTTEHNIRMFADAA